MLVRAHVRRVAALRDEAGALPERAVRVALVHAVGLVVVLALAAVEARVGLCANADARALLDEGDLGADADGCAYDFWGVLGGCGGGFDKAGVP